MAPEMVGIRVNEEPSYEILKKENDIEVRRYEKTLLAQISIDLAHDEAIKQGFQKLADYIFGGNSTKEKMSMTSPVFHEKKDNAWLISFLIPSKYTLSDVPMPNDPAIRLVEKRAKTVVALQYSGDNDEDKMRQAALELETWVQKNNEKPTSGYYWAQYDPPFTISSMKRNEVLVKLYN
jgi:SOUL heme-binding protein